jgi:hypothetical protein
MAYATRPDLVVDRRYLERKIERCKQQDRKANRDIDADSYITAEWLKKVYRSCCGNCGDCLTYTIKGDKVESNLTAQRINNDVAHHIDNILPYSKWCNCALSNKE